MKLEMTQGEFRTWTSLVKSLNIEGLTSVHNEIFSNTPPDGVHWHTGTNSTNDQKIVIVELDEEVYTKLMKIIIPRAGEIGKAATNVMSIPKLLLSLKSMGNELKHVFRIS